MPLYVKIDFRKDGLLAAWWSRNLPESVSWYANDDTSRSTEISQSRVRDVLIALADEIDPIEEVESKDA